MKQLAFYLILFWAIPLAEAADTTKVRKKFLVAGLNTVAYRGSLQNSFARWTPAYQIGVRFERKKMVNGMASLTFGSFIGEDRTYTLPSKANPSLTPVSRFRTRFFGLHYEAQFLLFRSHGWRIFASQGIGLFRFTVTDWDGNDLTGKDRTREKGESYNGNSLFLPFQMGFQYRFPNEMALGFQAGWMNPLTRYLDNMNGLSNNDLGDNLAVCRFQFYYPLK